MQKIKCLTVETLLDLYMNYLREKLNKQIILLRTKTMADEKMKKYKEYWKAILKETSNIEKNIESIKKSIDNLVILTDLPEAEKTKEYLDSIKSFFSNWSFQNIKKTFPEFWSEEKQGD